MRFALARAFFAELINRLWRVRDRFRTLHFHLQGNGGGALIPAYFIVWCLCGGFRSSGWMKAQDVVIERPTRIVRNRDVLDPARGAARRRAWNPWDLKKTVYQDADAPNLTPMSACEYFRLDEALLDLYDGAPPYRGKIVLHVDRYCGSATG